MLLKNRRPIKSKIQHVALFGDPKTKQVLICRAKYRGRKALGDGAYAKGMPAVVVSLKDDAPCIENVAIKKTRTKINGLVTPKIAVKSLRDEFRARAEIGPVEGLIEFKGLIEYEKQGVRKAMLIMPEYDGDIFDNSPTHKADQLRFIKTLLKTLVDLERKGVLHLDIKKENVLVRGVDGNKQFCLTDLGILGKRGVNVGKATVLSACTLRKCGTP